MTKRQLIEEIRQFNAHATPRFLSQFDPAALRQYLEHLKTAQWHRSRLEQRKQPRADVRMVC